jgi:hypothetical protein
MNSLVDAQGQLRICSEAMEKRLRRTKRLDRARIGDRPVTLC